MVAMVRYWWQFIKTHRITIQFIAIFLVLAIVFILIGYRLDWAGFNGYSITTTSRTIGGTTPPTSTTTTAYQPGRTLYDWLQLLFIPVVLAVAGFWFNHGERRSAELRADTERIAAELRAKTEQDIAEDNQRETALKEYIDKMSELLLHENLRKSEPEDEVRKIARVRTLTVLPRLDGKRKGSVIQFLYESGLIDKKKTIIDLHEADLTCAELKTFLNEVNLSNARLTDANLHLSMLKNAKMNNVILTGANLDYADLSNADLQSCWLNKTTLFVTNFEGANLSRANLINANMEMANLRRANLSDAEFKDAILDNADLLSAIVDVKELEEQAKSLKGARMPDGSEHA